MKYTILINQKAVIDNGWTNLTFDHLIILDVIAGCINSGSFAMLQENGQTWYWVKVSKILEQLPLIKIKERRCRDLLNGLAEYGLIEVNKNNQNYQRHYIRFGNNYSKLLFDTYAKNDSTMQNIAKHYAENCQVPMQKIANDNIIKNNTITNNDVVEKKNYDFAEVETLTKQLKAAPSTPPSPKEIYEANKEIPIIDIFNEVGKDQMYLERLCMKCNTANKSGQLTVEFMKEYLKQVYLEFKHTRKVAMKTRKDGLQHISNLIYKDYTGSQTIYRMAVEYYRKNNIFNQQNK